MCNLCMAADWSRSAASRRFSWSSVALAAAVVDCLRPEAVIVASFENQGERFESRSRFPSASPLTNDHWRSTLILFDWTLRRSRSYLASCPFSVNISLFLWLNSSLLQKINVYVLFFYLKIYFLIGFSHIFAKSFFLYPEIMCTHVFRYVQGTRKVLKLIFLLFPSSLWCSRVRDIIKRFNFSPSVCGISYRKASIHS